MLEQTEDRLSRLSPELRIIAEEMALASITAELREDLIPTERAARTAEEHRVADTEDWHRALGSAVSSLLALHELGYALHRRDLVA